MALLPSWVDAKNPPSWYNDGSDIDTLLDDADCLNWLSDTGDLDETYPPAMAEPAAVVSNSSTAANSIGAVSGQTADVGTIHYPAGGVFHPSTDSLSFLVDPPDEQHDDGVVTRHNEDIANHTMAEVDEDMDHLRSFLDEPAAGEADVPSSSTNVATGLLTSYASATEAVEATSVMDDPTAVVAVSTNISEHSLADVGESVANLVGFPDLDMGDEQAFVSALLENSGQSIMSFPKLNSDLQMCGIGSERNLALDDGMTGEEEKLNEYA